MSGEEAETFVRGREAVVVYMSVRLGFLSLRDTPRTDYCGDIFSPLMPEFLRTYYPLSLVWGVSGASESGPFMIARMLKVETGVARVEEDE